MCMAPPTVRYVFDASVESSVVQNHHSIPKVSQLYELGILRISENTIPFLWYGKFVSGANLPPHVMFKRSMPFTSAEVYANVRRFPGRPNLTLAPARTRPGTFPFVVPSRSGIRSRTC